jgi:hypothetical protein
LDSSQGPAAGSVAVSWYGAARPSAVNGFAGTISVQSGLAVASAADRAVRMWLTPRPAARTAAQATIATTEITGAE